MSTYVFAYGSLAVLQTHAREHHLRGFTRTWDVAMDNRVDLPGYKYYVDPDTMVRPAVYPTFLNLRPDPGGAVNGVLLPVSREALAMVDARERNYDRVAVTPHVEPRPPGAVYAYVGHAAARRRFSQGMSAGACAVDANYLEAVRDGFAALGAAALQRFDASAAAPPCPVRPLLRRDL
jgi:hypothetical protein